MADIPPPPPGPPAWAPPPAPPANDPPSFQPPPPPSYSDVPYASPVAPGYSQPARSGGLSLGIGMSQFGGIALWSIIIGFISVGVPVATGLSGNGTITFFYVLPIVGLIRGFQAFSRGQVTGGVVGMALNGLGGLISLWASGIL